MGQGGKGYHVVVELSKETFVFCYALSEEYRGGTGPMATRQFWEQLSERASVVGDLAAAEWFMEGAKQ